MNKFILFFIIIGFSFSQCSFIHTNWYLHPKKEFSHFHNSHEVETARVPLTDLFVEIWAKSNPYGTYYGPILIPFYPIEPPILNQENVYLKLAFLPGEGLKQFKGIIETKNFVITSDKGKKYFPNLITSYNINEQGYENISEHYSEAPLQIPIKENFLLHLNYMDLVYSEFEWIEMNLIFTVEKNTIKTPVLRFTPKRNSKYTPYTFPFMFAPVR